MPEDKKISELAALTALSGTEQVPVESGGANYKVAAGALTHVGEAFAASASTTRTLTAGTVQCCSTVLTSSHSLTLTPSFPSGSSAKEAVVRFTVGASVPTVTVGSADGMTTLWANGDVLELEAGASYELSAAANPGASEVLITWSKFLEP